MEDHSFCSKSTSKPHYYVFVQGDVPVGRQGSCFYRYDTAQEATALFSYLQIAHPDLDISLGIHKDFSRRADIVERIEGVSALSDDYKRTAPWKDDPSLDAVAVEVAKRLGVAWKKDRELVGKPVLIPNDPKTRFLPEYFEGKSLHPDVPGEPRTSIQEVFVQTLGWMTLDGLKAVASNRGHGNPEIPAVSHYLVAYQVDKNGFRGTAPIAPADFETMEQRYLAQQKARERQDSLLQPHNAPQAEILRSSLAVSAGFETSPGLHDTIKQAKDRARTQNQNAVREGIPRIKQKEPIR